MTTNSCILNYSSANAPRNLWRRLRFWATLGLMYVHYNRCATLLYFIKITHRTLQYTNQLQIIFDVFSNKFIVERLTKWKFIIYVYLHLLHVTYVCYFSEVWLSAASVRVCRLLQHLCVRLINEWRGNKWKIWETHVCALWRAIFKRC
jgi:hypothetical protein